MGEGGLPAVVKDGLLDSLGTPVRLGTAGPDNAVAGTEGHGRLLEDDGAERLGVVAHQPLQPPAAAGEIGVTVRASRLVQVAEGLRRVRCRLAQV